MSDPKVICTNELVVTFEQLDDGTVNWLVQPDTSIDSTSHASIEELASAGAPLSALGIRVLWEMLHRHSITVALERGNMHLWKKGYLELKRQSMADPLAIDSELAADVEEGVVIH